MFSATHGCLQFSTQDECLQYIPTNRFKHLHVTDANVTIMRMGVMANQGPHIRLSPVEFPTGVKINEIGRQSKYDSSTLHFLKQSHYFSALRLEQYGQRNEKLRAEYSGDFWISTFKTY